MKRLLLIAALLLCPLFGLSQSTTGWHRVNQILARAPQGGVTANVVPNAKIAVTSTSTGLAATIYSDPLLTAQITPPLVTADNSGNYSYYVPLNYCVTETITAPGQSFTAVPNICGNTGTLTTPITILNGGTGESTAAGANGSLGTPGPVFNVIGYGAVPDGSTDDTAAINSAIAALNSVGSGTLYFPAGSYKISSALTTFTVPAAVDSDGTCNNDVSHCVTEIVQATTNTGVFKSTAEYFRVEEVAVVNGPGSTGTQQSAGIGIDYCDPAFSYDDHFDAVSNQTEGFYQGIRDCNSEAGNVSFNRTFDSYYDGITLGTSGSSNLGDTQIHGNSGTGAGASANACIDDAYSVGGFATSNLCDQGISPQEASVNYGIYGGSTAGFYTIIGNHAEYYNEYCMYLLRGPNNLANNSCNKNSGASANEDIYIESSLSLSITGNTFDNRSATVPLPYAIRFGGSTDNQYTNVDGSNIARGYTTVQSGLDTTYATIDNHDYSSPLVFGETNTGNAVLAGNILRPGQTLTLSAGSGLTVNITASGGAITACSTPASGTGYSTGELVTVSGGSGGYCQVTAETGGVPSAVALWGSGGTGYSTASGSSTTLYGLGIDFASSGSVYVTANTSGTISEKNSEDGGNYGIYQVFFYASTAVTVNFDSTWQTAGPTGTGSWTTSGVDQFAQTCQSVPGGVACTLPGGSYLPTSGGTLTHTSFAPNWEVPYQILTMSGNLAIDFAPGGAVFVTVNASGTVSETDSSAAGHNAIYQIYFTDPSGGHTVTFDGSFIGAGPSGTNTWTTTAGATFAQVCQSVSGAVSCAPVAGGGAFSGGLGASYQDVTEIAAPSNPASGNDRLYTDSSTHLLACLTSSGGSCMPSAGSGGTTGSIGGSSLTAGQCATGTATLGSSATGHPGTASTSDGSNIQTSGGGLYTSPQVTVSGTTATVQICDIIAGTPTAKTYNVTVF